ncbi:MAG: L,D-transpeptidase [Pseudomonadota bacterium]
MRRIGIVLSVCLLALWALAPSPAEAAHPRVVGFETSYPAGTVIVRTAERRLYFILDRQRAIQYPVGVGRAGKQWTGVHQIRSKHIHPSWAPTPEIRRAEPHLPAVIGPGPRNPLGTRAMLIGDTYYAIHGTNRPDSIGNFVSWGCIRMHNAHIEDLFQRVRIGAYVVVTR